MMVFDFFTPFSLDILICLVIRVKGRTRLLYSSSTKPLVLNLQLKSSRYMKAFIIFQKINLYYIRKTYKAQLCRTAS